MARNIWGSSFEDEVSLMEFELGSRVTSDLLAENTQLGEVVVCNRASRVNDYEQPQKLAGRKGYLEKYVGRFIVLKNEPFALYKATEIAPGTAFAEGDKNTLYIVADMIDGPEMKQDGTIDSYYFEESLILQSGHRHQFSERGYYVFYEKEKRRENMTLAKIGA